MTCELEGLLARFLLGVRLKLGTSLVNICMLCSRPPQKQITQIAVRTCSANCLRLMQLMHACALASELCHYANAQFKALKSMVQPDSRHALVNSVMARSMICMCKPDCRWLLTVDSLSVTSGFSLPAVGSDCPQRLV